MVFAQRISRRQILKLAGAFAATAVLDVRSIRVPASAEVSLRSEWTFAEGIPSGETFETPVLFPDTGFDSVDLSWMSSAVDPQAVVFELRVQSKAGDWSEWVRLHEDGHADATPTGRRFIAPMPRGGIALQVQATIADGGALAEFTVGTFDAGVDGSFYASPDAISGTDLIDGFIIPRSGWGANESLRFEDGDRRKPMLWPPEYQPTEKFIIHHTVTENDPRNVTAMIRSVYYYHAVTRGWGDIGYNFLVDWRGRVFEGRYGGPSVIAGHSLQYNRGSIGVALLGNFDIVEPPNAAIDAIIRLYNARASHIDPTRAADFIDLEMLANVCGHRDVSDTSCPGEEAYPLIPMIRGRLAGTGPIYLDPPIQKETIRVLGCEIGPTTVYQGNLLEVRMRVHNPSASTIPGSSPPPGFIYDESETFDTAGYPKIDNDYRVCLDFNGNSGVVNPYRWGIGAPLGPGEQRTIVGYVRLQTPRRRTYSASFVKEFVAYLLENESPTRIVVAPAPVRPVPASIDPSVRFFSETGHNVPAGFNRYWERNGGLRRFGYPLTEAFEELSETDGGRYLTQYFERARFEYHPDYAGTKDEVMLGLLGVETTIPRRAEQPFKSVSPSKSTVTKRYFSETRHTLGGIFKRVWEERGGLPIFGYPISEEFEELSATDGRWHIVQYFERNRFELHPDYAGTEDELMLGHLGREVLIRRGWLTSPG